MRKPIFYQQMKLGSENYKKWLRWAQKRDIFSVYDAAVFRGSTIGAAEINIIRLIELEIVRKVRSDLFQLTSKGKEEAEKLLG